MQLRDFLYFIADANYRTYAVDADGNVVTTPSLRFLGNTPDGWQEAALQYARNGSYFGMFRTFTVPLGFVNDGAKIVRYLYYIYGIEAVGNLGIAKLDRADYRHKKYYHGTLNFSKITDSKDKAEIEVTEGGLSMMIKANEATVYEIPLDVPEAVEFVHDGLTLKGSASYVIQSGDYPHGTAYIGMLATTTEGTVKDVVFNTVYNFIDLGGGAPPPGSLDFLAANYGVAPITLNFDIAYSVRNSDGDQTYIVSWLKSDGVINTGGATLLNTTLTEETINPHLVFSVTLNPGERMFLYQFGSSGVSHAIYGDNGTGKITFDYRYRSTNIKALRPAYVFSQLISKITDGQFTTSSALLSATAKDFVLTCGDAIRGIAGAKIKTSLKDFFSSYNTRFNIGLGNKDEVAVIEQKQAFYTPDVIVDLGEISDLQITPASDYLYNTLKIGWPAQDYDDVNGKDEFNNTHNYTTPVKRLSKELDLTAPYRCDPYGIEFTRINLEDKVTTDNEADNDVFIINIAEDGDGGYILNRPAYSEITGVAAGNSIYNVELSPKRCLEAHGNYLHIGMDKLDDGKLTFQTTEKNAALVTILNGKTYQENADVVIGALAPKLFLPVQFQFDCKVPVNIVDLIEANPYGKVQFSWNGNIYRGYIVEASQQPATDAQQTFKLIASTDNDMTKLIV